MTNTPTAYFVIVNFEGRDPIYVASFLDIEDAMKVLHNKTSERPYVFAKVIKRTNNAHGFVDRHTVVGMFANSEAIQKATDLEREYIIWD